MLVRAGLRSGPVTPAISSASPTRRPPATSARRSKTCRRPMPTASRHSRSAWQSRRHRPGRRRPRYSSGWRRPAAARSSASWCCRWRRPAAMIGVKPLFGDKSVAEGDKAEIRRGVRLARRQAVGARRAALRTAEDGIPLPVVPAEFVLGIRAGQIDHRVADGDLTMAADKPSRVTLSPQPGRYRLDVKSTDADGPVTSVQFDVGWYSDGSADTPDLLETSIDKPEYASGDTMVVSVNARSAGKLTDQRAWRPPADDADRRRQGRYPAGQNSRSARTGAPAPMCWRRCAGRSMRRRCGCPAGPSA